MKIAIIQEWLVTVGGSDKVVKAIADVFPDADIYTLVAKKQVCDELGIDWNKVHTSFIQKLPLGVKKHRMYLPIFPFAIEQFDLRGCDYIIFSCCCQRSFNQSGSTAYLLLSFSYSLCMGYVS